MPTFISARKETLGEKRRTTRQKLCIVFRLRINGQHAPRFRVYEPVRFAPRSIESVCHRAQRLFLIPTSSNCCVAPAKSTPRRGNVSQTRNAQSKFCASRND